VTFLFTDVEGSTKLVQALGATAYADALVEHRRILRQAFTSKGGVEVDTQGDAFFYAFPTADGALEAAREGQRRLSSGPIAVRIGIHTGTPHLTAEGYVGADVHRGARICAAGHGRQVLISEETRDLVDVEAMDLGEHRVKDFDQPVWIFQLGSERFPPLKTISNTNLPRPTSPLIGREREVQETVGRLREGTRLLTLTGPGGTGKTRLAIEAASELVPEHRNGVFWVGLAALRDSSLVTDEIAQTLGAKDSLAAHIGEREMLLVLDNFEQVVDAAPELPPLLSGCPNLRLLVTSRELLRIQGEVGYAVPPLAEVEAVELFRVRSGLPPDDAIAELCRRLDNLPLAVELAAARARVLSPRQILDRLSQRLDLLKGGRDADPRQATLRATIAWSYELLSVDEQRAFGRLAVFRGGCTLVAAEALAEIDIDTLQSLVDKSLLRQREERFSMLETIREYAAERLDESGEAERIRERHFDQLLALAERAYDELSVAEGTWSPIIEAEHDNIRAALDWAREGRPRAEAQLAGAVAPYWMVRGHTPELRERLTSVLEGYDAPDRIRARALTHRGELDDSLSDLEDALRLWRELGDRRGDGLALEAIGWAHDALGDYPAAERAYEQSLLVRREAGVADVEAALARAGLCHALVATGEIERAEKMAEELLAIAAQSEASLAHQLALHFLADCALLAGDYPEAERRYRRALAYARSAGQVGRCTDEVLGIAMSLSGQGDFARAIRLAAASHVEQEAIGKGTDHWWQTMQDRFIGDVRQRLAPHEVEEAEGAGRASAFEAVMDEVLASPEVPRTGAS
jgi:predicted ATPase